ncbi:regucalcin-like [Nylanderia fulva]|uniref:regucalcin-like n=1 Tax=Nylanderia fulva TaxID=613905 RepID=UPI0010FB36F4|nr:regucalcin-like [Nylanderia fulva]
MTSCEAVKVERLTEPYGLSEGPHWDHRTQKLYFVDIHNQYIRRLDPATGVVTSAYIEHGPVGVAIPVADTSDKLVAGSGKDLILVTWTGDKDEKKAPYKVLSSIEPPSNDTRINDGKIDPSGRFWFGTMANIVNGDLARNQGSLYRVDDTLECVKQISSVTLSNGLAWNVEDNIFYYIDTLTRQVAAYDYDPKSGSISNKRIAFDLDKANVKGLPDGMTIDTDGNLWIALWGGYQVIQVNPKTQEVLRKVKIPAENVTSVAFGGPLLDILYVTTSGYELTEQQRKETPYAGSLFAVKGLGVRGSLANTFVMSGK